MFRNEDVRKVLLNSFVFQVEIQYREKEEACRELMNTLKYKSALCQDLESQLAKVIEKNTELTVANSDLQKKVS